MRIGFVGGGNMACALAGGLRRAGPEGAVAVFAIDPLAAAAERFAAETGGAILPDLEALVAATDVLVLAVKPQAMPALLPELARVLPAGEHLVVSIAAGITLRTLARSLGERARLVRAMPNTPALVGRGATVLVAGARATLGDAERAREIFAAVGQAWVVADEGLLDAVTAVSGSGPGFVFAWAEAFIGAAEGVGLPPDLAVELVRATLVGSGILWQEGERTAGELRAMVTSPGGTTQAGLEALAAGGFAAAVRAAVEAAARRSRELSGH